MHKRGIRIKRKTNSHKKSHLKSHKKTSSKLGAASKTWLIFGISVVVIVILFLVLYSPAREAVFGKAIELKEPLYKEELIAKELLVVKTKEIDTDGDGVFDSVDNCLYIPNGACSLDLLNCDVDQNGIPDKWEILLGEQLDSDKDGIGDACEEISPVGEVKEPVFTEPLAAQTLGEQIDDALQAENINPSQPEPWTPTLITKLAAIFAKWFAEAPVLEKTPVLEKALVIEKS